MAHTKQAGALPNASIDFAKVQSNAKAGKENVYEGATELERNDEAGLSEEERKIRENAAEFRAEEAGREVDEETQAMVDPATVEEDEPAKQRQKRKQS